MKNFDDKFLDELDEMEIDMPRLSEEKLKRIHKLEMEKSGIKKPQKKKINWKIKNGLVAACLIVAFGTTIPNMLNQMASTTKEEYKIITSLKDTEHSSVVELSNGLLNFGDSLPPMESLLDFDPETTTQRSLTQAEYIEYLGVDPRPSYMLTELIEQPIDDLMIVQNKDGTMVYDNGYFNYSSQDNKKSLRISTSKNGYPIDCAFIVNKNNSKSNINGIDVNVGYNQDSMYVATFMFNGIGYEVESYNIPQKEFIKILVSILQ